MPDLTLLFKYKWKGGKKERCFTVAINRKVSGVFLYHTKVTLC